MTAVTACATAQKTVETFFFLFGQINFAASELVKRGLIGDQCPFISLNSNTKEESKVRFHLGTFNDVFSGWIGVFYSCFADFNSTGVCRDKVTIDIDNLITVPVVCLECCSNEVGIRQINGAVVIKNVFQHTVFGMNGLQLQWFNIPVQHFLSEFRP